MKKRKNNISRYNNVDLHFSNTNARPTNKKSMNYKLLSVIHLLNVKFKKQIICIGAKDLSSVKLAHDANSHLQ